MSTLTIRAQLPYDVVVEAGAHDRLPDLVPGDVARVAIVHPHALSERAAGHARALEERGLAVLLLPVPDGESAKSIAVLTGLWDALGEAGFTRSDLVVGLGGGSTTDLAGFLAASWLRGVRFATLPTTVLGMVDAAVGGKTGINVAAGKNLVGAFHEPIGVLCDLDALATLPRAELSSGLAEVVKCGFIDDLAILELVESHDAATLLDPTSPVLEELITRGIAVKARAIDGDLRETAGSAGEGNGTRQGSRALGGNGNGSSIGREAVNYGHTLGHAIERASGYTVRHGEAISIGMVFVAELAHRTGLIGADVVARHRADLSKVVLPTTWDGPFEPLLDAMRIDKKARGAVLRFVVLDGLGHPTILAGPDEDVLRASYEALSSGAQSSGVGA